MKKLKIGDIRKFNGTPDVIGVVVIVSDSYYVIVDIKGEFNQISFDKEYSLVKLEPEIRSILEKIGEDSKHISILNKEIDSILKEIRELDCKKREKSESLQSYHQRIKDYRSILRG